MRNETNATKAADARCVMLPRQLHALSASVAFSAFENGRSFLNGEVYEKSYFPAAAEPVKDSAPVASGEKMDYFRFMAEAALDQGFLTPAGFSNLMDVHSREDLR